nr:ribonuclease H-like domain-containing protein [Tanacetum cinerariifolium]
MTDTLDSALVSAVVFSLSASDGLSLKNLSPKLRSLARCIRNKMHKAFPMPVIKFGDSYKVPAIVDPNDTNTTSGADAKSGRTVTITTEDMQRKKNDVKARTTLLLSLLDEHQLRFSKYKTAKELWAAILKTFGEVENDDLNQKFLTSLAPEWLMHTIVWRNRNDLDTMSLDDLYNHLKDINQIDEDDMEEMDIKWSMALLSMRADKFWKRTGKKISIQGSDVAGFDKSKVECFNCHKMGHFARECRAPRREDHALVADATATTEFALMANTESKVFDNSLCSKGCKKNNDSLNSKIKDLTDELFEANNYIYHYKLAVAQLEGRLVEYKEKEVKYIEKIRTLELYRESNLKSIESFSKKLDTLKLEKDGVDGKLAGLLKASKNLDNLIESQTSDKVKDGVGYNVVPPPAADLYLSPKKDLSWTVLPEFVDDTVTDYSRPSPTVASTLAEGQNKNSTTSKDVASPNTSKPFVKFVKPKDNQSERKGYKRETTRSQNHVYMSPKHISVGHRPHGAPMRPPHRSVGHRPHGAPMRPPHRSTGHKPHDPSKNPMRPNMNGERPNKSFFIQAHSYETRPFLKTSAVKTQYRAPWVPTVNRNNPPVNRKFSTGRRNFPTANRKFPTASRKFPTGSTKIHTADMGRKGKAIKPSACWIWKPIQNLSNKGLNNNSVSVMFKKYTYIDTQGRLKTPRQHNMYSIDLNNIVPHKDLTCLVVKASVDECILWHRRL